MEQYTTATTSTGEQIVVQTAAGQIQQQVRRKGLFISVMYGVFVYWKGVRRNVPTEEC